MKPYQPLSPLSTFFADPFQPDPNCLFPRMAERLGWQMKRGRRFFGLGGRSRGGGAA